MKERTPRDPNIIYKVEQGKFGRNKHVPWIALSPTPPEDVASAAPETISRRSAVKRFGEIALGASTAIAVAGAVGLTLLEVDRRRVASERESVLPLPKLKQLEQEMKETESTWEYTAQPGDTYWDIVVAEYGFSVPEQIYGFIESNIENETAIIEGREETELLEGLPYTKEPLFSGDRLKIIDPIEVEPIETIQ